MCFLPGLKLDFKEPASKRQRGENKENAVPEKPKKDKKRLLPSFLPLVSSDGPKACLHLMISQNDSLECSPTCTG